MDISGNMWFCVVSKIIIADKDNYFVTKNGVQNVDGNFYTNNTVDRSHNGFDRIRGNRLDDGI